MYLNIYKYTHTRRETSTDKSLSPWEPRTLTKEKEGIHALKNRKYGNIFPFPPGSLQQRERDVHCKPLKQERTNVEAGREVRVAGWGAVGQGPRQVWESKTYCLIQH